MEGGGGATRISEEGFGSRCSEGKGCESITWRVGVCVPLQRGII